MRASIVAAGVLAVLCAQGAKAATVITMSHGDDGDAKPQTMILDSDRLRLETPRGGMIYRGDLKKVFVIEDKAHSYMELSPDSMQKMKGQMDQAMARMQQQMASMPEAQRKQIEAMMASRGMPGIGQAAAAPQVTYQRTGPVRKVGTWACTPVSSVVNGNMKSDLCVARLSDAGLTRDDLKPLISLSTFMGTQLAQMGGQASPMASTDFDSLTKAVGFEGFPVQTVYHLDNGQHDHETTVQSVEHKDVPADTFDIPAGYTKREMGGPHGGE
jgi:hypothetical protein